MNSVLIIDDDPSMGLMLTNYVKTMGHMAIWKDTLTEGLSEAVSGSHDVVLLDVQMPDGNGLEFISQIRGLARSPEVIIMTGYGDADGAEKAIRCGAWGYITKTDSPKKIQNHLERVVEYRKRLKGPRQPNLPRKFDGIIGESTTMASCVDLAALSATSDSNVLLTGETGTGKELFARTIHRNSSRSGGNFIVVDCAALPENLVESILLGHEKGSFTGADFSREGLVSQAHNGTLFLDEVGEMPLGLQKSFLRVLQERRYRPVGGKREYESDFRLVAATNRNLETMSQNGGFRPDLLFRIRTMDIVIPPLREREADVISLANHHIEKLCSLQNKTKKRMSSDFSEFLLKYDWPGNVRELINAIESSITTAGNDDVLFSSVLPEHIRISIARNTLSECHPVASGASNAPRDVSPMPTFKAFRRESVEKAEKEYLKRLFERSGGDVQMACRISALSRSRYYELMKLHGIDT